MSERLFPGVVSNAVFLTQALDASPGDTFTGPARTLSPAVLEGWGRSGSLFTLARPRGGWYFVRGVGGDAEGWFESWTAQVQSGALVESDDALVRGVPVATALASEVSVGAPAPRPSWIPVAVFAAGLLWKVWR